MSFEKNQQTKFQSPRHKNEHFGLHMALNKKNDNYQILVKPYKVFLDKRRPMIAYIKFIFFRLFISKSHTFLCVTTIYRGGPWTLKKLTTRNWLPGPQPRSRGSFSRDALSIFWRSRWIPLSLGAYPGHLYMIQRYGRIS